MLSLDLFDHSVSAGIRRRVPSSVEFGKPAAKRQAEAHATDEGSEQKGKEHIHMP
jgi:hypothetical protein